MNTIDFDGQFRARVFASSQDVEITFHGVQDTASLKRLLTVEQLDDGYTETLTVVANDGETFEVLIESGCAE